MYYYKYIIVLVLAKFTSTQVHDIAATHCVHTLTHRVHVLNLAPASNSNLNFSTVLASICTSTTTCNYYFEVHVHLDLNLVDCI